jgi:hypothetical protein
MGIVANRHTGFLPDTKAEAERIAATRTNALASIVEAMASFDRAGQHYWQSDLETAVENCKRSFALLREARAMLHETSIADIRFEEEHKQSPKLIKSLELGLDHYEYKPNRFLAQALAYDRRLIAVIEHLLASETVAVQALENGDLKTMYVAVSTIGRYTLEVAAEYLQHIVHDSRITHEVADTIEMV